MAMNPAHSRGMLPQGNLNALRSNLRHFEPSLITKFCNQK